MLTNIFLPQIDTTVYVCGIKELLLPSCRRFTYETVRIALQEQHKQRLPQGLKKSASFHYVYCDGGKQTKFTISIGCSSVGSSNHGCLLNITRNLQPITMPESSDLGLGRAFLFPNSSLREDAHGYPSPTTIPGIRKKVC